MSKKPLLLLIALIGASMALAQQKPVTQQELAKVEQYYLKTKKEYEKNPKSAPAKATYTKTGVSYGEMVMKATFLPPREMYPRALRIFRDVKKADPKNVKANDWIKTIEGIYKSMGRPIPK